MSTLRNIQFAGNTLKDSAEKTKNWLKSGNPISQIVLAILFIFVVIIIVNVVKNIFTGIGNYKYSKVWFEGGRCFCPKTTSVIPGKYLHRSLNKMGGVEFSIGFWMYINDFSFKYGQWKSVMFKGNSNSWPSRAPGIWLHPRENTMRFYMNTFDSIAGNFIDVENLPLSKWFHVVLTVNQLTMDVYINGAVRKSFKFTSMPKQNYGDMYIQAFRGFDGYLCRAVYYNYAIPYSEVQNLIEMGPGDKRACTESRTSSTFGGDSKPPYLDTPWWTSTEAKEPEYDRVKNFTKV